MWTMVVHTRVKMAHTIASDDDVLKNFGVMDAIFKIVSKSHHQNR